MSNTMSALRGTPRAKPNDMTVRVGASASGAEAVADLLLERVGVAVGRVDDMVGPAPQRRQSARARAAMPSIAGRSGASGWRRRVSE